MSRALGLFVGTLLALPLAAQDSEESLAAASAADSLEPFLDRTPESCVQLSRVRRTRIIDDETVLFFLRGQDIYQNILPNQCHGLKRSDRFMYETRAGRLCSSDTIQVLEDFGPGRLIPTQVCRLGKFHPLSELEADEMIEISSQSLSRRERRQRAEQAPIEVEEVELPPEQRRADTDGSELEEPQD